MSSGLSPKLLAQAIGVSESSLKRWVDEGLLNAGRTVGGHRRIVLSEAIRFIRQIGATVVKPEILGLNELASIPHNWNIQRDVVSMVHAALESGEAQKVRAMTLSMYLGGWTPAAIFDGPVREAMTRIGELWLHSEWGIVVEHRATDIALQAINQLRLLCPVRKADAPVALGCAAEFDQHLLPTLMASTVLGELGFLDVNLGALTPPSVLLNAAKHYKPKLIWMCASVPLEVSRARAMVKYVQADLAALGATFVLGGRGFSALASEDLNGIHLAKTMLDIERIGHELMGTRPAQRSAERLSG